MSTSMYPLCESFVHSLCTIYAHRPLTCRGTASDTEACRCTHTHGRTQKHTPTHTQRNTHAHPQLWVERGGGRETYSCSVSLFITNTITNPHIHTNTHTHTHIHTHTHTHTHIHHARVHAHTHPYHIPLPYGVCISVLVCPDSVNVASACIVIIRRVHTFEDFHPHPPETTTVSPLARRAVLSSATWHAAGAIVLGMPGARPAVAAGSDADTERILAGYSTLCDLIDNWGKYAGMCVYGLGVH